MEEILKNSCAKYTSIILNWGEDTEMWEISLIMAGERFTAESVDPKYALLEADKKAIEWAFSRTSPDTSRPVSNVGTNFISRQVYDLVTRQDKRIFEGDNTVRFDACTITTENGGSEAFCRIPLNTQPIPCEGEGENEST